jgi:hypothetical protein
MIDLGALAIAPNPPGKGVLESMPREAKHQ